MDQGFYARIGQYYDTDAIDYDSRYWSNPVIQEIRQSFREEVRRYRFGTMLEIGCGTGLDLVHFGTVFPQVDIRGIDVSPEMIRISGNRIADAGLTHVQVFTGSVEDCPRLFAGRKFDMIYVFFGALNTAENLPASAAVLKSMLAPGGRMVVTFVNKWYLAGMLIEAARFRFRRSVARLRPVWGGYSPVKYLPSRCYSPAEVRKAFSGIRPVTRKGYSIVHPAWFYTGINRKLGRIRKILLLTDKFLNRTPLWRFGEYTLFTFE
jgi:SAM-dependent methyltransferase